MITYELRDEVFSLVRKFHELHIAICMALIEDSDERREKAKIMLNEAKVIVREL